MRVPENERELPISSSTPPAFTAEQRAVFTDVLNLLSAHKIPFAISGAFALHQHTGIWRDTKDLDVFLVDDQVLTALAALRAAGFETEICDPVWLCKARRGQYFVDLITGMSNAVVIVQNDWIERASHADIFGMQVKVLAAEELIASKLFVTRRERFDGADVVHVIHGTAGKLDWSRILQPWANTGWCCSGRCCSMSTSIPHTPNTFRARSGPTFYPASAISSIIPVRTRPPTAA